MFKFGIFDSHLLAWLGWEKLVSQTGGLCFAIEGSWIATGFDRALSLARVSR
jgi:hypothetical protein